MWTLKALIEQVLLEGLVDELKLKYPGHDEELDTLSRSIKSKYLRWAADQAFKKNEPLQEIIDALRSFEANVQRLQNKDIAGYATLASVRDALASLGQSKSKQREITKKDADVIFDEGDIIVVHPKTENASCHYGKGSKWCIAATETENYFNSYSGRNIEFYFVIDRQKQPSDPTYKIALVIQRTPEGAIDAKYSHAFNALDQHRSLDQASREIRHSAAKIIALAINDAKNRPPNPIYEALTTKDVEKIRALHAKGENLVQIIQNPNTPEDIREDIMNNFMEKMSDEELSKAHNIPLNQELIPQLVAKKYVRTLDKLLLDIQYEGEEVSDEIASAVLSLNNASLSYVLSRCDGISPSVAHAMLHISPRTLQGIADNKTYAPELHKEIIQKAQQTNNMRAIEVLFKIVQYTNKTDVVKEIAVNFPNAIGADERESLKFDLINALLDEISTHDRVSRRNMRKEPIEFKASIFRALKEKIDSKFLKRHLVRLGGREAKEPRVQDYIVDTLKKYGIYED